MTDLQESDEYFRNLIGPLAHHLFPDGCPCSEFERQLWPHYVYVDEQRQQRHPPTPPNQALDALTRLQEYSREHGLTRDQICVLAVIAGSLDASSNVSTLVHSRLVDTDCFHFRLLVQCLLPKRSETIPSDAICRLLSKTKGTAKSIVLCFITLALEDALSDDARHLLDSSLYGFIFTTVFDSVTALDAIRLLLLITKQHHVSRIRRLRLERLWNTDPPAPIAQAVNTLLLLYESLSTDRHSKDETMATPAQAKDDREWQCFPDADWETNIRRLRGRSTKRRLVNVLQRLQGDFLYPSDIVELLRSQDFHHRLLLERSERIRFRASIMNLLREAWYKDSLGLIMILQADERQAAYDRLDRSRSRILSALASFTAQMGTLLPEAEEFIVTEVLSVWDGTAEPAGTILCHGLIPYLAPRQFVRLTVDLDVLESLVLHGDAQLQHMIISGAFAGLVNRWGRLDWANSLWTGPGDESLVNDKEIILRTFVWWVDHLLVRAFLSSSPGHELLRVATVDFFMAVVNLGDSCPFLASPSASLCYRLLLSSTAVEIDRVCQLLVAYRHVFLKLKQSTKSPNDSLILGSLIKRFNCFLWDFSSALWRCPTSSEIQEKRESGLTLLYDSLGEKKWSDLAAADESVSKALSITHGAAFVGYAIDFISTVDTGATTPSIDMIRGKLKLKYLGYLQRKGFEGIHAFISSCIGHANRKGQQR